MKKIFWILCVAWAAVMPCFAADNLLSNGDFEEAKVTTSFPGENVEFIDWTFGGIGALAIETTDVYEGKQALKVNKPTMAGSLSQDVVLYETDVVGQEYELVIHYKTITAAEGDVSLSSMWETKTGYSTHDAEVLQQVLPLSSDWKEIKVKTTFPEGALKLIVRVSVKKGNVVLFDDFKLTRTESKEPWYTLSPEKINTANCNIGDSVLMATLIVRQGNLTQPVNLMITGEGKAAFRLEKSQATAAEESIKLWFAPTATGIYKASLLTDCSEALDYNTTRTLYAVASDSTLQPEITLTPSSLPAFTAQAGESVEDSITVTGTNCITFIYASCQNTEENGAFRINSSLLPRNSESKVCVTFNPSKAGNYSATITFSTTGAKTQTMVVTGTATEKDSTVIDWATDFTWDTTAPLTLLKEGFDNSNHNQTLHLDGWQNVVLQGARPWRGYTDTNNDGEHCAKATAYIWGETDSTLYEMWLVTPALNYKNAKNQVFTFRVRGDYVYDGQSAKLQLYYIDATDTTDVYTQDLQIDMPATEDQAGDWLDFQVNLTGQTTIADIFYMGFCFTGYSGTTGAATYLIDDVSWGRDDLPLITADSTQIIGTAVLNEAKTFNINITGQNLTESVTVSVAGNNKSKFKVSPATLSPQGGTITVTFQSDQEGVHQAYLRVRSRGAVDLYIPMAVLVKNNTAVDNISTSNQPTRQLLYDRGMLYIRMEDGTCYTLLGQPIHP